MRVAKNFLVAVFMGLLGTVIGFSSTHAGTNTAQEQANMKLVADFYAALEQDYLSGGQRVRSIAERYLTPGYVQHMEAARGFGQGREGYIRMFEQSPQVPPPAAGEAPRPPTVMALMAQGDLVVRINSRPGAAGQDPIYIFNLFRVQDGKLAEHWDGSSRPIGSQTVTGAAGASADGK